jgi:hypothetical protein
VPQPGERLWTVRKDHVVWTCELCDLGAYGFAARILLDRDVLVSWRFETRALAVEWAEEERHSLSGGSEQRRSDAGGGA